MANSAQRCNDVLVKVNSSVPGSRQPLEGKAAEDDVRAHAFSTLDVKNFGEASCSNSDDSRQLPLTRPPDTLANRYVVLGELGRGGMGVVYHAYDPVLRREVAVKRIGRSKRASTHQLLREAQAMALVSHPNVVRVYEAEVQHGAVLIIMEYVDGCDLSAWLRDSQRTWVQKLALLLSAGEGLAAAHRAGIVHRDFKPGNVLVGLDGVVRVADFGIATEVAPTASAVSLLGKTEPSADQTTIVGTPAYMAPEQGTTGAVSDRADQYAFCVSAWEALFDERPFRGPGFSRLQRLKLDGPPSAPTQHAVSKKVVEVLRRGLSPQPEERFQSMAELLSALRRAVTRRGRRWVIGAMVVACLAAGGYGLTRSETCTWGYARVAAVWDRGTAGALRDASTASGASYAAETAESTIAAIDDYAESLAEEYGRSCHLAGRGQAVSAAETSRETYCIDSGLNELTEVVDILRASDAVVWAQAVRMISQLPDPARCRNAVSRENSAPEPKSSELLPRVRESRERLRRSRVLERAGQYDEALTVVRGVASHGYGPLNAERALLLGSVHERRGDYSVAREYLESAFFSAREHGPESVAAQAANDLVFLFSARTPHRDQARRWARHAAAESKRLGRSEIRAAFHNVNGLRLRAEGDHQAALEQYRLAERAWEQAEGPQQPRVMSVLINRGFDLAQLGRYAEAESALVRARELMVGMYGPGHPEMAPLLLNLSKVFRGRGETSRALSTAELARDVAQKPGQPRSLEMDVRAEIVQSLQDLGETVKAGEQAVSVVEFALQNLRGRERLLAICIPAILDWYRLTDRDQSHLLSQVAATLADYTGDSDAAAEVLVQLGRRERDRGSYPKALAMFRRAQKIYDRTGMVEDGSLRDLNTDIGFVLGMMRSYPDARHSFEEGLRLAQVQGDHAATRVLHANLALACDLSGDLVCAEGSYRAALAGLDEGSAQELDARASLAGLLLRVGKEHEVVKLLRPVAGDDTEASSAKMVALAHLSRALLLQGNLHEAKAVSAQAMELRSQYPGSSVDDARTVFARAMSLKTENPRSAEARDLFQQALRTLSAASEPGTLQLCAEVLAELR